jgi:hypothetical protein
MFDSPKLPPLSNFTSIPRHSSLKGNRSNLIRGVGMVESSVVVMLEKELEVYMKWPVY